MAIKRKATIIQVAEKANVAFSTVSRVMNGGYASQKVRDRVERVARELGYTPSLIARNLKMGRTGCIGVVTMTSQGSWFTQVLGGIEEALEELTISALLGSLELRGRYDSSTVARWIDERRVDGLVFARCTPREKALIESARKARIPMVFVAPDENFAAGPIFKTLNREGALELGRHLVRLGHRRVGFLGGPHASVDTRDRLRGLRDGLAEVGITIKKDAIHYANTYGSEDAAPYAPYTRHWLKLPRSRRPTAVACGNDALALGFMRAVLQAGVRVPKDVSVTGFDDVTEGALYWPGLTTLKQPSRDLGMASCKMLLRMIEGEQASPTMRVDLPARIVLRESTGPVP
jgi:DNA-binding LacI/PurR family transcriptional regulator